MQHKKKKRFIPKSCYRSMRIQKKIHPGKEIYATGTCDRAEKRLLFCRFSGWKNFVPLI